MDRPIPPEPADIPQIKRAFKAARRTQWLPAVVGLVCAPGAWLIGTVTTWYIGLALVFAVEALVIVIGCTASRCPKCGRCWGTGGIGGIETELTTLVCRRCRLDIGPGLRD